MAPTLAYVAVSSNLFRDVDMNIIGANANVSQAWPFRILRTIDNDSTRLTRGSVTIAIR